MPKNTPYLNIPMKDPATDGQHYFDVELMINDPLEMIDSYAQTTDQDLAAKGLTLSQHSSQLAQLVDYLNYMPINGGDFDGNNPVGPIIDGGTY